MRKTTAAVAGALFLAAVLALTGCPNSATVQPAGDKTPSNTVETKTEKAKALSTSGTMGTPETKADGSATLTTTDSNGGRYTFTQPAAAAASIRSSSSGGTWDYTNSTGIKQFAGSYSGDITSSGANSLSLTVEKAADPSGKLQEVTEPQSFDFEVSASGTFSATIPAVEIAVQVEPSKPQTPPAATVKLIKTVTMTESNSGPGYYTDDAYRHTCKFYSDNTFTIYADFTRTFKEVNFTHNLNGPLVAGTYVGNPLADGVVTLTIEKWNEGVARYISAGDDPQVHAAYIAGATSKTSTITEAALEPLPPNSSTTITISGDTFSNSSTFSYTPNEDNSTTFRVNASGDVASSVSLSYTVVQFTDDKGSWSSTGTSTKGNFSQRIPIADATEKTGVSLEVFLDKDGDGSYNSSTDISGSAISTVPMKLGHHVEVNLDIRKLSISFDVQGDTSQYQNIHIISGRNEVSLSEGTIDVLLANLQNSGSLQHLELNAVEMPSGAGPSVVISDTAEYNLWKETPPTHVTFTLYNKLQEGRKITIETYPADATFTDEEKKHFRFVQEGADDNIIFYIPIGTGSDGEFLSTIAARTERSLQSSLIASTYANILSLRDSASNNLEYQFTGLIQNMQDVVRFLENRKGLTVYGKELIGL